MQFSVLSLLGAAAAVAANTVTFKSLDDVSRTVYFTENAGLAKVDSVKVPGKSEVKVDIPQGWVGNYYAVTEGAENNPGMLGEVAFNGWNGMTYFDVSAIVNPHDHSGVKEMYPAKGEKKPVSGCKSFPCNNAYYLPDDVQTKTTHQTDLITTLGGNGIKSRDVEEHDESPNFKRDYVLGRFSN